MQAQVIQATQNKMLKIYKNERKNMLTFEINNQKASFHHRDLVSIYYFIVKNIHLYLTKNIYEQVKALRIKNAVFVSNVIDEVEKKIIPAKEVNLDDRDRYYRVAVIVVSKTAIHLNLASLFEIKRKIEQFFEENKEFEMKFYEKDFNLVIKKQDNITTLDFLLKQTKQREVIRVSKDNIKVLIRNLREKMIYDFKLYNVAINDKFAIIQTRKKNTFILKINNVSIETGRDVILAISLSV